MSAARSRASSAAIMPAHRRDAPLGDEARQPRLDAQEHAAAVFGVALAPDHARTLELGRDEAGGGHLEHWVAFGLIAFAILPSLLLPRRGAERAPERTLPSTEGAPESAA
jgi:hypothetical protein